MTDLAGQQLGNYRLLQRLGQGGFAEVYLGKHVRLGMKAAIKVLQTHLLTRSQIAAFRKEARTLVALTHPHIVHVLDFDVQDSRPFLVLDYVPNGSLHKKHPRGSRVPLEQIVSYVQQVANALDYAHAHKLIHRDVKPENMLISKQGEILLSDFGIVTLAHAASSINTEAALGTLAYMAPEQIQGKPCKESDQYALAVTVYCWLTGKLPFAGSLAEIIAQHLGAPSPSLREIRPDLPVEVEQVVFTALAKDPSRRFRSMQAFARALTIASGHTPMSSPFALESQVHPPKSAPDIATKAAAITSAAHLFCTRSARPSLMLPMPLLARLTTPPGRDWIVSAVCGLVLLVLLTGILMHMTPGKGTESSPYRLSASDSSAQNIGITLALLHNSGSSAPAVMVTSLQLTAHHAVIDLTIHGSDIYQCQCNFSLFRAKGGFNYSSGPPMGSLSAGENKMTFAGRPQAGEEWRLDLNLDDQNYGGHYLYQVLYLQF